jgi:hypothetical protein
VQLSARLPRVHFGHHPPFSATSARRPNASEASVIPNSTGHFDRRGWGASESASAGKLLAGTALKKHVPFHPVPDCRVPKYIEFG